MQRWIASLLAASSLVSPGCKTEVGEVGTRRQEAAQAVVEVDDRRKIGVSCRPGHLLDATLRGVVETEALGVYAAVRDGRLDDVWGALHPQARQEDKKPAFMEALHTMQTRLQPADADASVRALHVVEVRGGANDLARVICEGTNGTEGFTMLSSVGGEDLAVITLHTAGEPFGLATTVQLRMSGDTWRLVGIQVNPTSYNGKDAAQWEALADAHWRADKPVPAYFALGVAQTLSTRGGSISTASKDRINEKLEGLRNDKGFAEDTRAWRVDDQRYDLAGVSLASTLSDISPVIKYVSRGGLERETLEREADILVAHVRKTYPDLADHFDAVVFEAYAEPPTEAGRSYDAFRLARFLDPSRPSPEG